MITREIMAGLLIPEMAEGEHSHIGVLLFATGFRVTGSDRFARYSAILTG
jgi:hypothetical protein